MPVEIGNIVEGKVSGITKFGAFVDLPDGRTGLVHISEVSSEYVKDINTHLKENQKVRVKVLSMDDKGKVSLSIRKAQAEEKGRTKRPAEIDWQKESSSNISFEDRLAKFMKDSDEKMSDLKKNFESKRGSRSYRKTAHF